jgi:hypothetical protein
MNQLKNLVYVSIISADNDEFGLSEDDKQEIMKRYKESDNWEYILEPIKNEEQRKLLIDILDEKD